MKTLFAGMAAVLGLVLAVPGQVDAQECVKCEMDECEWEGVPMLCHYFPGSSETPKYECEATEDFDEESVPSGPIVRPDGNCDECHEEPFLWLCNWNHTACYTDDLQLAGLFEEVDSLVSSLSADVTRASTDPGSKLVTRVVGTQNLMVDPSSGTLRLSRCGGQLVAAWRVPEAFLELVSGEVH